MANKLKMIRDLEPNVSLRKDKNTSVRTDAFTKEELSEVIYAIIRKLNYMYDTSRDKLEREAILDKKSRLILQLILLEDKIDKLNYPNSRARVKEG